MFRSSSFIRAIKIMNSFYLIIIFSVFIFLLLMNSSASLSTGSIDNHSGFNDSERQSENSSYGGLHNVHIYVSNKDNGRLDVSLFIDSEMVETKSVSSDSEDNYGSYPLPGGVHSFKITWWDEDVKKSFEREEIKDINEETSVNLYTTLNDKPEKFDISVKLTNENKVNLDAYLYVDDAFEKNKEVSKESTSDLGKLSLEEGVHNLSVRWRDKDTEIEYEKKKRITVSKDDVVVFYIPAGISFDAVENANDHSLDTASPIEKSSKDTSLITDKESAMHNASETSNSSAESSSVDDSLGASKLKAGSGSSSSYSYPAASESSNSRIRSMLSDPLTDDNSIYLYAGLLILSVYLLYRH